MKRPYYTVNKGFYSIEWYDCENLAQILQIGNETKEVENVHASLYSQIVI